MDPDIKFAAKVVAIIVSACILAVALLRWLVPMILNTDFAGSYVVGGVIAIFGTFGILLGSFKLVSIAYLNSYKG